MAVVCTPFRRTCTVEKPSQKNRPPTRRSRRRKLIQMGFATQNRDFLTRGGLYILYSLSGRVVSNSSRSTWSRRVVKVSNLPARPRRVGEARRSTWSRRVGEARPRQEGCGQQCRHH